MLCIFVKRREADKVQNKSSQIQFVIEGNFQFYTEVRFLSNIVSVESLKTGELTVLIR